MVLSKHQAPTSSLRALSTSALSASAISTSPIAPGATRQDDKFGRVISIGTLGSSRRTYNSRVERNRPTSYEFKVSGSSRVNFRLRNDRELDFLNLNLGGANNITVDLFRNRNNSSRVFEVEPEDREDKTYSLGTGTYRLRLKHGGTNRTRYLDYRLEIQRRSNNSFNFS